MIFNTKKIHYLIPISLAVAAFQVLVAVSALTINWLQLQEIKNNRGYDSALYIQQENGMINNQ